VFEENMRDPVDKIMRLRKKKLKHGANQINPEPEIFIDLRGLITFSQVGPVFAKSEDDNHLLDVIHFVGRNY
jgi:hypothetical protein